VNIDGIVLVDKPKGWTSFDVVAKIRGVLKRETGLKKPKVGHTGTLDPMATGLLIIVSGKYTKRAGEFSKLDKVYEAELTLGYGSTTDDDEGEKTQKSDRQPSLEEIQTLLNTFVGEQLQLPPAFSAIKINGQRAYKLARAGKEVVIEPRSVTVYSIANIVYDYPKLNFTIKVSSGTYIRSIARDIGNKLGTGAYLSALKRTEVGGLKLDDAVWVDDFTLDKIEQV
jgi:tRNA pseudouridine55 synthase